MKTEKQKPSREFGEELLQNRYVREIVQFVREVYGTELEFLWPRFPECAILRRASTQKWYGGVMLISRRKLGQDSDEKTAVLNLRAEPEEVAAIVDSRRFYPAYHSNKRRWFTVCLDGTVSMDEIFQRICTSWGLAK